MANLRRIIPGEPFQPKAADWNAFAAAAQAHQNGQLSTLGSAGGGGGGQVVVTVKNNVGADVDRFSIVALTTPLILPTGGSSNLAGFKNAPTFTGGKPVTADVGVGRLAIFQEPVKDGKLGQALLSGVCPCQINMTDTTHKWADATNNDATKLTSGATGVVQILWVDSGTGTKWALVRIGMPSLAADPIWLFEVTSSTPTAATGGDRYWTCDRVILGSGGSPTYEPSTTDTGLEVFDPVYDHQRNAVHLDGEHVCARSNPQSGRWEMITANPAMRLGKVNQVGGITKGATGTVDIYSGAILAESSSGISVTAANKYITGTANNGKWCLVFNVDGTGWYISSFEA